MTKRYYVDSQLNDRMNNHFYMFGGNAEMNKSAIELVAAHKATWIVLDDAVSYDDPQIALVPVTPEISSSTILVGVDVLGYIKYNENFDSVAASLV